VGPDDQRRVKSSVGGEEKGEGRRSDGHASGTGWPPTKHARSARGKVGGGDGDGNGGGVEVG
jgi:hypothetical protein